MSVESPKSFSTHEENVLLTPSELASVLDDVVVVDVSDPTDFEKFHIPEARNVPRFWTYRALEATGGLGAMCDALREALRMQGIDGDRKLVFTEQFPAAGFGRSSRALYMSEQLGIPMDKMHILDGGNRQWKKAGFPIVEGRSRVLAAAHFNTGFHIPGTSMLTGSETLKALERGAKFIDVRNSSEFLAREGAPYKIMEGNPPQEVSIAPGRIPGALGLPWTDVFEMEGDGAGKFKRTGELIRLFTSAGIEPDDDIVVYCFKGARSSAVLLALRLAGFTAAKMYFAGWNEWSRCEDMPKETGEPQREQLAGRFAWDL